MQYYRMRFAMLLLALFLPAVARAATAPGAHGLAHPSTLCEAAIVTAEYVARLPNRMLGAIAEQESGRFDAATRSTRPWPWSINAEGAGRFFATRDQAIAAARTLQAQGVRSIDVGCMQINLLHHPNAFASLEEAFDPRRNASYAATFLTTLHGAKKDWIAAIGAYHSETPALGAAYRALVLARWQRPDIGRVSVIPVAYSAFPEAKTVYRAFAASGAAYGNSPVPVVTRR
jgi:hypothetical protein